VFVQLSFSQLFLLKKKKYKKINKKHKKQKAGTAQHAGAST